MFEAHRYVLPLLMVVTVLTWPSPADAELVAFRAEGRVHKVDANLPADSRIYVGARFVVEFSYETGANRTIVIKGLRIGPARHLAKHERLYGTVNHFSRAGGWDRLRLSVQSREASSVGGSGTDPEAFNVKIAFDSRTEVDSALSVSDVDPLSDDGLESLLSGKKFFHFIYSGSDTQRQSAGLISGEITSLTRIGS